MAEKECGKCILVILASLEGVFLTATIDAAHEGCDVMTADVPNAFIQTQMPERKEGKDRVIMKITGVLVDLLVELDPQTYKNFVLGKKVVYVAVLKAIYGMLQAPSTRIGFVFNDYDPCIANRMKVGKQHTIRFHVDDIMARSHVNSKVNDKFKNWMNQKYGSVGEVKSTRGGKIHEYLGMTFDFTCKGKLKVRMDDYVKKMIEDFSVKMKSTDVSSTPATNNLFEKEDKKPLDRKCAEEFHGVVAKGLFLAKRARGDIHQLENSIRALYGFKSPSVCHLLTPDQAGVKNVRDFLMFQGAMPERLYVVRKQTNYPKLLQMVDC
eukprot:scaffold1076_cov81-Cylindrotheca_fusiformis.AAC.1